MNEIINIPNNIKLNIFGDNNKVIFGKNVVTNYGTIDIGLRECNCNNCILTIGDNTHFSGPFYIRLYENETNVHIGKDCLISENFQIWASDSHSIFDDNNLLINRGKFVIIDDHVWIGQNCSILKNVKIPYGCIVGMNSTVTSSISKQISNNSVIAGNPAKCVKTSIKWSKERPNMFL